jgi:hypothetical protein
MFERRIRSVRLAVRPSIAVGWSEGVWPLSSNPSHQVQWCLQHVGGRTMPQARGRQGLIVRPTVGLAWRPSTKPVGKPNTELTRFSSKAIFVRQARSTTWTPNPLHYRWLSFGMAAKESEAGSGATAKVASPTSGKRFVFGPEFKVSSENTHVRDRPHAH